MGTQKTKAELRERFANMYKMYLEGYSYEQIGRRYGVTRERVRQIFKSYSSPEQYSQIQQKVLSRRISPRQIENICSLIKLGDSCSKIAETLGCSVDCVKRVSSKYKLQELAKVNT